jgi:hypothetical protein
MDVLTTLLLTAALAATAAVVAFLATPRLPPRIRYELSLGIWTLGCVAGLLTTGRWPALIVVGLAVAWVARRMAGALHGERRGPEWEASRR